jgi:hypothetical protein
MRNEHEAPNRDSRKAIDYPIDLPDRSPDLNMRSGASIAFWIAFDNSALRSRMCKCATSVDGAESCTASISARRATTSAVRLLSQSIQPTEARRGAARRTRRARSIPRPLLALPQRCRARVDHCADKPRQRYCIEGFAFSVARLRRPPSGSCASLSKRQASGRNNGEVQPRESE